MSAISGPPKRGRSPGNASRARELLGWSPEVTFQSLVKMMVDHDLELARQERTLLNAGHNSPASRILHA